MARIAGVNIPMNKHVWVGLTHIFGVGRTQAQKACDAAGVKRGHIVMQGSGQQLLHDDRVRQAYLGL